MIRRDGPKSGGTLSRMACSGTCTVNGKPEETIHEGYACIHCHTPHKPAQWLSVGTDYANQQRRRGGLARGGNRKAPKWAAK
jgi:hypothetical protein